MKAIVSVLFALSLSAVAQFAHAEFRDNGNGTVTDLSSNLQWQRCSAPSDEINCTSILPVTYIWDDALAYCNALALAGYADWRLPNVKELQTIVDVTKTSDPTINTSYFPDTQVAYYWSSTTSLGTTSYAWYVNFNIHTGKWWMTSSVDKRDVQYVRCVR